jgi:GNAT superfamily N-acetyltransferase
MVERRFPHWRRSAQNARNTDSASVHVARAEGEVIGFAASWGGGFGPIGVVEEHRGRGVGTVLLLRCLRDVRRRGHERAHIGWANVPFYAKAISAPITRVMWQMQKRLD